MGWDESPSTWARQSMADLSSVVSFLTGSFFEGMSASLLLALRGPGRFARGFAATGEAVEGSGTSVTPLASDVEATVDVDTSLASVNGFHRGHFLASSESAGTSFTSLTTTEPMLVGEWYTPLLNGGHARYFLPCESETFDNLHHLRRRGCLSGLRRSRQGSFELSVYLVAAPNLGKSEN